MEKKQEREVTIQQINFYIMREIWKIVKRREVPHENYCIHEVFDMSRQRYDRFINGYKGTKLCFEDRDNLSNLGIPSRVFDGDSLIEISGYGLNSWKEFFEVKYKGYDNKIEKAQITKDRKYLNKREQIKTVIENEPYDKKNDFAIIYNAFKKILRVEGFNINNVIETLDSISWDTYEQNEISVEDLLKYRRQLMKQLRFVMAKLTIKKESKKK